MAITVRHGIVLTAVDPAPQPDPTDPRFAVLRRLEIAAHPYRARRHQALTSGAACRYCGQPESAAAVHDPDLYGWPRNRTLTPEEEAAYYAEVDAHNRYVIIWCERPLTVHLAVQDLLDPDYRRRQGIRDDQVRLGDPTYSLVHTQGADGRWQSALEPTGLSVREVRDILRAETVS